MNERIRRAGAVAWAVLGLAGIVALLGLVAWYVRVIWPPLIFAGAIVFLLNPIVTRLQHRHIPRAAGAALAYLGFFAIIALVGLAVVPLASHQADDLRDEWPHVRDDVERWIDDRAVDSEDWIVQLPSVDELEREFNNDGDTLSERFDQVRDVGLRIFHLLLIALLAPIIAFYLLVDLPHLRKVAESLIPPGARTEVLVVGRRLSRAIGGFFRGQLFIALIVGIIASLGLLAIRLPFWLIVGMVAGLFNIIPLIGPWVGAVPGIVIALTTGDVQQAIGVAAVMALAQQIDNHFISPLVMQRAVKLHPAAVMMALLAGGTLMGFFGLLLAVPTAAVLKILGGHLWRTYVLGEPIGEIDDAWRAEDAEGGTGMVETVDRPENGGDGLVADEAYAERRP